VQLYHQSLIFFRTYFYKLGKVKSTAVPVQTWTGPRGSRSLRLPEFLDNQHMKEVKLSVLSDGRVYILVPIPFRGWVDPRNVVQPEVLCQ
jgi:hypothetical protein